MAGQIELFESSTHLSSLPSLDLVGMD